MLESESFISEDSTVVEESVEQNPYAYLNRDFSSENFKIEVKNMPKFYGFNVCYTYCKLNLFLIWNFFLGVSQVVKWKIKIEFK